MGLSNKLILTCDLCGAMPLGGDKGVSIHHEPVQEAASENPEAPPPKKVDPEGARYYRVTTAEAELVLCAECWHTPKIQDEFWACRKIIANGVA